MIRSRSVLIVFLASILFITFRANSARKTKAELVLAKQIDFLLRKSKSPHTIKAIRIYSTRERRTIYDIHSRLLLHPASNLKIITTAFALDSLGPGYMFMTDFGYSGTIDSGTITGNLVITADGDPILSDSDIDVAAFQMRRSGIVRVDGNIMVDISRFDSLEWGEGWMWDDEPEPYAMFISPACVDHNVVTATASVDSLSGNLEISLQPQTDFVNVADYAVRDTTDSLRMTRKIIAGRNTVIVSGRYSPHLKPITRQFSVRHPSIFFASVVKDALRRAGIAIGGKLEATRENIPLTPEHVLCTIRHAIDTVITYTNKESDNLGAECLLRTVPIETHHETGSARNGIGIEQSFLDYSDVDTSEYYIVDGSGVSHYNLVTPHAITRVLVNMLEAPDSIRDIFVKSLPIGGVDGTLNDRMGFDSLSKRILAKTGSISGVSSLSGYILLPTDTLVFSMMMEDFVGAGEPMRDLQDSLCNVLIYFSENSRHFVRELRKHKLGTYSVRPRQPKHRSSRPVESPSRGATRDPVAGKKP